MDMATPPSLETSSTTASLHSEIGALDNEEWPVTGIFVLLKNYGAPFVSKILWHSMDKNRFDLYKIDSMCCRFVSKILWHSIDKNRFDLYKIDSMCRLFQNSYDIAYG